MRKLHDRFFKQAKREGRLARSVYKLAELDQREHLLRPGMAVLDIGSAPGSWLEHIVAAVGPQGAACAVDIKPIDKKFKKVPNVSFKMVDVRLLTGTEFIQAAPDGFDVIVSDMAPNTTGIRITDQARSLELCECALALALRLLKPDGSFVCKIFSGPETEAFKNRAARHFRTARFRKPEACREESFETYVVCRGFQKPAGE